MDLLGGDTHSAAHGRFFKYVYMYICHYNHQHELLKMVGMLIYMCVCVYDTTVAAHTTMVVFAWVGLFISEFWRCAVRIVLVCW